MQPVTVKVRPEWGSLSVGDLRQTVGEALDAMMAEGLCFSIPRLARWRFDAEA